MSGDNLDFDKEKELRISDLFLSLINYKAITLISVFIPLLVSVVYLINREIYYEAEIEVYENKMISSFAISSYDYKAPYLSYLDAFKSEGDNEDSSIDSERLYNSYISILRQIDQDLLNKLEFNKSKPFMTAPFSAIYGKLDPSSLLNSIISFSVLLVLGIIKIPSESICVKYSFIESNWKVSL